MDVALQTYINDHLAGAQYALNLLNDLAKQTLDSKVADTAAKLIIEVGADKDALEECSQQLGGETSVVKEAAAWVVQKFSKPKLAVDTTLGLFEAVEVLTLGVNGKRALWSALRALPDGSVPVTATQLEGLIQRAEAQMALLECLRLRLAVEAFGKADA